MSRYILQPRVLKRLSNGHLLTCRRCGASLHIGETVVSKAVNGTRRQYHAACYDRMHY